MFYELTWKCSRDDRFTHGTRAVIVDVPSESTPIFYPSLGVVLPPKVVNKFLSMTLCVTSCIPGDNREIPRASLDMGRAAVIYSRNM